MTAELFDIFTREVSGLGGEVKDVFNDGETLLARSVLPGSAEVRAGDKVFPGVAIRSAGPTVALHPYVFRQVCKNGSIMAWAVQTRVLDLREFETPEQSAEALAGAIQSCAEEEAFAESTDRMRSATEQEADLTLNLLPLLGSLAPNLAQDVLKSITTRFTRDGDGSRYGLFNAVTAVARTTRDPRRRWRLEEFGGGVLAVLPRAPRAGGTAARALVEV